RASPGRPRRAPRGSCPGRRSGRHDGRRRRDPGRFRARPSAGDAGESFVTTWDDLVRSGRARVDLPLAPFTTYKLGGPARYFVEAEDVSALEEVGEALRADSLPVLVLGRGSNLLWYDAGLPGVVMRLGTVFSGMEIGPDGLVLSGVGVPLPRLARAASKEGGCGLEWGVGIPGSVGGAVRQNAGCFGREVVDVLVEAEVVSLIDGTRKWKQAEHLDLSYRHSNVAATDVVISARFSTVTADPEESAKEMKEVTRWRRDHQPGGTLNAGSVFKNPPGEAAGEIIDRLGLKGFAMGPVRVSPRHANFIEAGPGASAAAVRDLIVEVRRRVDESMGMRGMNWTRRSSSSASRRHDDGPTSLGTPSAGRRRESQVEPRAADQGAHGPGCGRAGGVVRPVALRLRPGNRRGRERSGR